MATATARQNQKYIPFILVAVFIFLICFKGGVFSVHTILQVISVFSTTWLTCIILFLFYPRCIPSYRLRIFILSLAFACYISLSFYFPVFTMPFRYLPYNLLLTYNILFYTGGLILLFLLMEERGICRRWLILYAFNPVILYGFTGQNYFGAINNFFIIAAIYSYDRKNWTLMFLSIGMAVQTGNLAGIAVLPFLINRNNWKRIWVAIPVLLFIFLFRTASQSVTINYYLIHEFLNLLIYDVHSLTSVRGIILLITVIAGYSYFHPDMNKRFRYDPVSGCFFVLGAIFLFLPHTDFSYLCIIMPFLILRPFLSWFLLCFTIGNCIAVSGIAGNNTNNFSIPEYIIVIAWLPFLILFVRDIYLAVCRAFFSIKPEDPQSISVIIPTCNEADNIKACISAIIHNKFVCEVIVVDNNSTDKTAVSALESGARVIEYKKSFNSEGGRGGQIRSGIMSAEGDVIVVLHADSIMDEKVFSLILTILRKQPAVIGGSVGVVFDAQGWRFRLLEYFNELRVVLFGISFGDQVQFFRRKPIVKNDLFPDTLIMEDVELSIRLNKLGRQVFLFGETLASARRWKEAKKISSFFVFRIVIKYLWQRMWRLPDTSEIYQRYYNHKKHLNIKK